MSDLAPTLPRMPTEPPVAASDGPPTGVGYPAAERLDLVEGLPVGAPAAQQRRVADPYRWLEDVTDPRTAAWSAAQDELVERARATWPGRDALAARLTALAALGAVGPPVWRGARRFRTRRAGGADHAQLLVEEPDPDGPPGSRRERVLLDPLALDPSGLTTLDAWQPSKEGHLLAHQTSEGGTEESVLRVVDVATGELVDGPVDRVRYSPVAWVPGGEHLYYVRRLPPESVPDGEERYHRRVWRHRVGADPGSDVEVFGAGRPITSYYGASVSLDGRWLVVSAREGTAPRNDCWIGDLAAAGAGQQSGVPELVPVAVGLDASTSAGVGLDGRLYVHTDHGAPRGRVAVADPSSPGVEHWRDLVPERDDAVLEDVVVLGGAPEHDAPGDTASDAAGDAAGEGAGQLLVAWTTHAISEVTVHDPATGERTGALDLPGRGSVGGLLRRPEGGHEAWFTYTDTTTPARVLRYDALSGAVEVEALPPGLAASPAPARAASPAPGRAAVPAPDPAPGPAVETRVLEATSADGTTVRMLLVAPAGAVRGTSHPTPDRPRPTLLHGYGGFGVSMAPGFSSGALAWVEAGGLWVTAQLRGGGEEGEEWRRDGMLGRKQHVFDDHLACAQALVDGGWTTPAQLGASGGSNGGLLVGAALTQRPDLFGVVLCSAPLLDMVRYQRHGLGATWASEYGDAERVEDLAWLHAYSPYHRVAEAPGSVAYPATLFTVFDGDSRVDPLHARKTCAALQHATSRDPQEAPVLLRAERDVGHGARAVSRSVALLADSLAFAAARTGLDLAGLDLAGLASGGQAPGGHGDADGPTMGS